MLGGALASAIWRRFKGENCESGKLRTVCHYGLGVVTEENSTQGQPVYLLWIVGVHRRKQ